MESLVEDMEPHPYGSVRSSRLSERYSEVCRVYGVEPHPRILAACFFASNSLILGQPAILDCSVRELQEQDAAPFTAFLGSSCHDITAIDIDGEDSRLPPPILLQVLRAAGEKLRRVDLTNKHMGREVLKEIFHQGLPCRSINLTGCHVRKLPLIGAFVNLHTLFLDHNPHVTSFPDECFTRTPHISRLSLCATSVSNMWTTVAALSRLSSLSELRFQQCQCCPRTTAGCPERLPAGRLSASSQGSLNLPKFSRVFSPREQEWAIGEHLGVVDLADSDRPSVNNRGSDHFVQATTFGGGSGDIHSRDGPHARAEDRGGAVGGLGFRYTYRPRASSGERGEGGLESGSGNIWQYMPDEEGTDPTAESSRRGGEQPDGEEGDLEGPMGGLGWNEEDGHLEYLTPARFLHEGGRRGEEEEEEEEEEDWAHERRLASSSVGLPSSPAALPSTPVGLPSSPVGQSGGIHRTPGVEPWQLPAGGLWERETFEELPAGVYWQAGDGGAEPSRAPLDCPAGTETPPPTPVTPTGGGRHEPMELLELGASSRLIPTPGFQEVPQQRPIPLDRGAQLDSNRNGSGPSFPARGIAWEHAVQEGEGGEHRADSLLRTSLARSEGHLGTAAGETHFASHRISVLARTESGSGPMRSMIQLDSRRSEAPPGLRFGDRQTALGGADFYAHRRRGLDRVGEPSGAVEGQDSFDLNTPEAFDGRDYGRAENFAQFDLQEGAVLARRGVEGGAGMAGENSFDASRNGTPGASAGQPGAGSREVWGEESRAAYREAQEHSIWAATIDFFLGQHPLGRDAGDSLPAEDHLLLAPSWETIGPLVEEQPIEDRQEGLEAPPSSPHIDVNEFPLEDSFRDSPHEGEGLVSEPNHGGESAEGPWEKEGRCRLYRHASPMCEENHYRTFLVASLPQLRVLDNMAISVEERAQAKQVYIEKFEVLPNSRGRRENLCHILQHRECGAPIYLPRGMSRKPAKGPVVGSPRGNSRLQTLVPPTARWQLAAGPAGKEMPAPPSPGPPPASWQLCISDSETTWQALTSAGSPLPGWQGERPPAGFSEISRSLASSPANERALHPGDGLAKIPPQAWPSSGSQSQQLLSLGIASADASAGAPSSLEPANGRLPGGNPPKPQALFGSSALASGCRKEGPVGYRRALAAARMASCDWSESASMKILNPQGVDIHRRYRPRQFEYNPIDPQLMVMGTLQGEVVVLSHETGVIVGQIQSIGAPHSILGLCWLNKDPSKLVGGCDNGSIQLYDVNHMRASHIAMLRRNSLTPGSASRSSPESPYPPGSWGSPGLPTTPRSPAIYTYEDFEQLTSVHINCTDDFFVASGYSNDVGLYDLRTGRRLQIFRNLHQEHINVLKFAHHSPHLFATSSFDRTIKLWDVRQDIASVGPVYTAQSDNPNVMVCFSRDDHFLLSSAVDNEVRQHLAVDGRLHLKLDLRPTRSSHNYTRSYYMNNRDYIITGSCEENTVRVCCSRTGRMLREVTFEGHSHPGRGNKTSPYVQSLRGDPWKDFHFSVLVAYHHPTSRSEVVKVNLMGSNSAKHNDREPRAVPQASMGA